MGTRYDRGLFKQNQELTQRKEALESELRELRPLLAIVKVQSERIDKLEAKIAEITCENRQLQAHNEQLREVVAKQAEEILRLKSQLKKDSSNSSKPPSSDGYKKVMNGREKSGRNQGGQPGHKGTCLRIPQNLDELVEQGKAEHIIITKVAPGEAYTSDWAVGIKIIPVYTETRRAIGTPPKIEYGTGLTALVIYLSVVGLVAVKRLSEFMRDITHGLVLVSKGTIQKMTHEAAEKVELEPLINDLLNSTVMNVDETPIRTTHRLEEDGKVKTSQGTTLTAYIRTYSNARSVVLTANGHKNGESVVTDNILNRFVGIVVQDYEAKFLRYGNATALCGAHLSRELKGLAVLEQIEWAGKLREFFWEMNERKNADVSKGITRCDEQALGEFVTRYDELVVQGQEYLAGLRLKSYKAKRLSPMVKRMAQRKEEYMLFMRDYNVPYTNNQAERDLRHCKTKQKISGCYRSWDGIVDYCKLRSFIETTRRQGGCILDTLATTPPVLPCPAGQ